MLNGPIRNMENIGAGSNLNCEILAQEISEDNNINMLHKDCFVIF